MRSKDAWDQAMEKYRAHWMTIEPALPREFVELSRLSFHDAVVKEAVLLDQSIVLTVDHLTLLFVGVSESEGVNDAVDDIWLYEEIDEVKFGVNLSVLLEHGEMRIQFRSVAAYDHRANRWTIAPS